MTNFYRTIGIVTILLIFLYEGLVPYNPIHDFNNWIFDRHYRAAIFPHPNDSVLLAHKSYFGGPDDHGSGTCIYSAGEFRSSKLTKIELEQRYATSSIVSVYGLKKINVDILFPDDPHTWPLNYPLGDWFQEFSEQAMSTTTTIYLIYAEEKYPFFGDLRCDD